MPHKVLGMGTYGCVLSPAFQCPNDIPQTPEGYVSKLSACNVAQKEYNDTKHIINLIKEKVPQMENYIINDIIPPCKINIDKLNEIENNKQKCNQIVLNGMRNLNDMNYINDIIHTINNNNNFKVFKISFNSNVKNSNIPEPIKEKIKNLQKLDNNEIEIILQNELIKNLIYEIIDFFKDNQYCILNMPNMGNTLTKLLEDPLFYTTNNIIMLFDRIIDLIQNGIIPMNNAGVFHCDIKGDNVLVKQQNPLELILIDWGISTSKIEDIQLFDVPVFNMPLYMSIIYFINVNFKTPHIIDLLNSIDAINNIETIQTILIEKLSPFLYSYFEKNEHFKFIKYNFILFKNAEFQFQYVVDIMFYNAACVLYELKQNNVNFKDKNTFIIKSKEIISKHTDIYGILSILGYSFHFELFKEVNVEIRRIKYELYDKMTEFFNIIIKDPFYLQDYVFIITKLTELKNILTNTTLPSPPPPLPVDKGIVSAATNYNKKQIHNKKTKGKVVKTTRKPIGKLTRIMRRTKTHTKKLRSKTARARSHT